jgi:hypothetical protein
MYGPQIWSHNLKTRAEEGLGLGFTVRLKRVFWGFLKCKALRRETSDDFIKKKAEDCKTEERERERERESHRRMAARPALELASLVLTTAPGAWLFGSFDSLGESPPRHEHRAPIFPALLTNHSAAAIART